LNAPRMPALFVGHGSPMQAIEPNAYTAQWLELVAQLPRPRAILSISAHWYTRGTGVTMADPPPTIHDFYGFPAALYACQYPAPGSRTLAARVRELMGPDRVREDTGWGLDHGTWSVLRYLYPAADIPVVQLSIDGTLGGAELYQQARALAPLREAGVLVLGSGNVVHNLRALQRQPGAAPPAPALAFNAAVRKAVLSGDHATLMDYAALPGAEFSVPTPEHYLPLLFVLAIQDAADECSIPVDGMEMGSLSMMCVLLRAAAN